MRTDIKKALRGRSFSFLGAYREIRRLGEYLHEGEEVHDLLACTFGDTKGRALLVVTDERVLAFKDGWIFRNSQGMGYQDIRSLEIRTGLFWARLQFKGEGMSFTIAKVGRFSAEHAAKIIRSRIGSRYNSWEKQQIEAATQRHNAQNPVSSPTPEPTPTAPKAFYETEAPLGLEQFTPSLSLTPATSELPVARDNDDLLDKLERLKSLRESGMLSPEEYVAAKNKLLG